MRQHMVHGKVENVDDSLGINDETQGFTQVIRPSYEGPCGFYKTESDGRQIVLPFALNKQRGLYIATYVVGSSVAEAQRRAHKLHEIWS